MVIVKHFDQEKINFCLQKLWGKKDTENLTCGIYYVDTCFAEQMLTVHRLLKDFSYRMEGKHFNRVT